MTTVISSPVKDKNRIFTGYEIFITGKILAFHRCLYNKVNYLMSSIPWLYVSPLSGVVIHLTSRILSYGGARVGTSYIYFVFNSFTPKGALNQNSRQIPNFIL